MTNAHGCAGRRVAVILLLAMTTSAVGAFVLLLPTHRQRSVRERAVLLKASESRIVVPAAELDENMSKEERAVIGVVRKCGPSVAFVTSIIPRAAEDQEGWQRRQRRPSSNRKTNLPPGQGLGSGSGFVVKSDGYIVTNYHVIERAYQMQQMAEMLQTSQDYLLGNVTAWTGIEKSLVNSTLVHLLKPLEGSVKNLVVDPKVYVRIDSATQYRECRIVNVKPELDVAVLKVLSNNNSTSSPLSPLEFGQSSDLLVGQSLVAIGNPFGLDNTVTTGVVSALNRELTTTVGGPVLRGCIQTDCAINPGNSGGPLLNRNGKVVGMNTAIYSTSGSNAGIGFAVPSDDMEPVVTKMIVQDRVENGQRPNVGFLGISIVKGSSPLLKESGNGVWVSKVDRNSPAAIAGIQPLTISDNGRLELGDCVVAIGGSTIENFDDLRQDLEGRVAGEEIAVTLETVSEERRVVYVKLVEKDWK